MRVIPALLIKDEELVKGKAFESHKIVGDPSNAIRIFSQKEADEIMIFDITASIAGKINFELIERFGEESYVPLAVGGGIRSLTDIEKVLHAGAEKVCLNTSAINNPVLIMDAARRFGSQAITVCVDVRFQSGEYIIYSECGKSKYTNNIINYIRMAEDMGAGELVVSSIDKDGTKSGYDLNLISLVSSSISIPVVALGGASGVDDIRRVSLETSASACAVGAFFTLYGKMNAPLIRYPKPNELEDIRNEDM
jgi:imidazole glycerol-phosphate synthase subunit HisF